MTTTPYELLDRDYRGEAPAPKETDQWEPGLLERLFSWQGELVDRAALRLLESAFLSADNPDREEIPDRIEALKETYARAELVEQPDSFFRPPGESEEVRTRHLGEIEGGDRLRVTFRSPYEPFSERAVEEFRAYRKNDICAARLWRHRGESRGTILCLHYWCGGRLPVEERVFGAETLYDAGFDVALMTLPFHGRRTPEEAAFSGQYFPSRNLRRTNEAFGQAVADVRFLARWLEKQGCGDPMGLFGISLGGYVSALLAGIGDRFAFAVPMVAPASVADLLWWHGSGRPAREKAADAGITLDLFREIWAVHSPLSHELQIPRENVLILAAAGDAIVRPVQPLALWRHWDEPELHWFTGSHLAHFGRGDYVRRLLGWLDERI